VVIDRAFVEYAFPKSAAGLQTRLLAGKTDNPFRWSNGPDFFVWDSDFTLEGASLQSSIDLSEHVRVFANTGAYLFQELPSDADPKVVGLQIGASVRPAEGLEIGLRGSGYDYRSLDTGFVGRALSASTSGGNLATAFDDGRARVGEAAVYLRYTGLRDWPVMLWGTLAHNWTAESGLVGGVPVGAEDDAMAFGVEIGDAKRFVRAGVMFFEIQANSLLSQFLDSEVFDGRTNVNGYMFFVSRALRPGLELRLTFSDTDALRDRGAATGPFTASLRSRDRRRLQTDLLVSF
jgi:hypothetical protein